MTSPGPAFRECTWSCHVNVPAPKALSSQSVINRWSDCIDLGRDSDLKIYDTLISHKNQNAILERISTYCGDRTTRLGFLSRDVPPHNKANYYFNSYFYVFTIYKILQKKYLSMVCNISQKMNETHSGYFLECLSFVFWEKLRLNNFVSRFTDLYMHCCYSRAYRGHTEGKNFV